MKSTEEPEGRSVQFWVLWKIDRFGFPVYRLTETGQLLTESVHSSTGTSIMNSIFCVGSTPS